MSIKDLAYRFGEPSSEGTEPPVFTFTLARLEELVEAAKAAPAHAIEVHRGRRVQAVPMDYITCEGCCFWRDVRPLDCSDLACIPSMRDDGLNVVFKELK